MLKQTYRSPVGMTHRPATPVVWFRALRGWYWDRCEAYGYWLTEVKFLRHRPVNQSLPLPFARCRARCRARKLVARSLRGGS
jgi:hypothetical protein